MAIISLDQMHMTLAAHRTHITGLNPDACWLIGPDKVGFRYLACLGGISRLPQ